MGQVAGMDTVQTKICGLTRAQDVEAVAAAGATYAGFVFFEKSPRYVTPQQARDLAVLAPVGLAKVALVVDATDASLDQITDVVPLDMLQLHGRETPERVAYIRARYGLPVMKAVGVADESDLAALATYSAVADQILVDTKPPKGADLPGGNGVAFDWQLIAGRRWDKPWMLAGGLNKDTVARAIAITGARQVDLSSAVESAPGIKDAAKVTEFVAAAKAASGVPSL